MSQLVPQITLAQLTTGPSIDSRTITAWLQIVFGQGYYTVGGVPSGIAAFVSSLGIDDVNFLFSNINSEATQTNDGSSLPVVAGITYKYIPSTDKIQLFTTNNGLELTASEAIPYAVLNDTIVGQFIYNRI
jgi:hypothetical protein